MASKTIEIGEPKNSSTSSSSSVSSTTSTVCHIDRVDNYILFDILKRLPIRDIIRTGNVCTRWRSMRSALGARQRRIMLFDNAMQPRLNYITSHTNQSIDFDLWRFAIRIAPLKSANKFCAFINFIMQTFPAISMFEFVCQIDRDMFRYMIKNVLRRYAAQLTHLRLIFAIRTKNSSFCGEKSIQFSYTFPALRHFMIYCDNDIAWNYFAKDFRGDYEDFLDNLLLKNMPVLEELFYGLRSRSSQPLNRNSRLVKLQNFPHLKQFALLHEQVDYPSPILFDWLQSVDDLAARRLIDFRLHSTKDFPGLSPYTSLIADKFRNLRYLQLNLWNNLLPIDDLLRMIVQLGALAYLRIFDTPNDYFTEKIEQYYQDNGPKIAPSYSLRNLHFSFINWNGKFNSFRNGIPFSSLSSTLSSIFPALEQIRQSDIRVTHYDSILPEMHDILPPERESKSHYFRVNRSVILQTNHDKVSSSARRIKIETINGLNTIDQIEIKEEDDEASSTADQSVKRWLCPQIDKVVRELKYLDISCIAFSADELLDLLPRLPQLNYLRIVASRHYFFDLDAAMQRIITDPDKSNQFESYDQLQTLHIDRIWSASDDDPYRISLTGDFCRIASKLWPNIRTLKFDGLISNIDCFELVADDERWLSHLPRWFHSLRKIFLLKQRLPLYCVTPKRSVEPSFRLKPTQFEMDNSKYDIRYLSTPLSDKEEEKLLRLRLTIVQRVLNITETSSN